MICFQLSDHLFIRFFNPFQIKTLSFYKFITFIYNNGNIEGNNKLWLSKDCDYKRIYENGEFMMKLMNDDKVVWRLLVAFFPFELM